MARGLFSAIEGMKKYQLKNKPKYDSKKQKEYYQKRKWKIRKRANKYAKEIREIWIERGLCSRCGKEKENIKFKSCFQCRLRDKKYYYKKKVKPIDLKEFE